MKLRLPNKLIAALLSAMSAAVFTTLASGTAAYGSTTYDDLTKSDYFEANENVYNTGKGTFYLETETSALNLTLTLNLNDFAAYQAVHDYANAGYYSPFVTWTYNNNAGATYGMADVSSGYSGADYSGVTGMWNGSPWATNNKVTTTTLQNYADADGNVTLTINNSPVGTTRNVVVTAANGDTLYVADGLRSGSYESLHITSFTVNMNYVKSVTLNSNSILDSSNFTAPKDYTIAFDKTRAESVGRIVFLGDSITHGVEDMSWRWGLFKTMVDNGIENEIAGPLSGYHSTPLNGDYNGNFSSSQYGGATFDNAHYAQSSGRTHNMLLASSGQNALGNNTGVNYGGVTSAKVGKEYNGDTYVMMMGTNDILSDGANTPEKMASVTNRLLGAGEVQGSAWSNAGETVALVGSYSGAWGTMGQIIDNMQMDAGDTMYVMSIPTWAQGRQNIRVYAPYVAEYNEKLKLWTKAYSDTHTGTIKYVDVNRGLVDKTLGGDFLGPDAFFRQVGGDYLHPNEQGALIIAGNLAQGMGLAGRTAGLHRADSHTANTEWVSGAASYTINAGQSVTIGAGELDTNGGYTVDFSAVFGNGATDGWLAKSNALSISVGDGANVGTLKLSEGYISWGDKLLFCQDNSVQGNDAIRIAYHTGDSANQVGNGYYVWLGDMLIGQALSAGTGTLNGITLSAAGATGTVSGLTYSNTAYAPTSTGMASESNAFYATISKVMTSHDSAALGIKENVTWQTTTNAYVNGDATAESSALKISHNVGNAYTGATNVAHTGDISVQYAGEAASNYGAIGVLNAVTLTGDLYMEFNSDGTFKHWTGGGGPANLNSASVAGSYNGSVTGSVTLVLNNGSFDSSIYAGAHSGDGTTIGGTDLYVNGGNINGSVFGGGRAGTIETDASVTVTGGTIVGSVYGGGAGGSITGSTSVTITGGVIQGSVNGGMLNDTEKGTVTVAGNKASIGGDITAETVKLKDVAASEYSDGFDKYAGTITAANLVLDNYTAGLVNASLVTDYVTVSNGTNAIIRGLHLRNCSIDADATSLLTLGGDIHSGNTISYTGNLYLEDGITFTFDNTDSIEARTEGLSAGQYIYKVKNGSEGHLYAVDGSALTSAHTSTFTGTGDLAGKSFFYENATGALIAYGSDASYTITTSTVNYSDIDGVGGISMSGGQLNLDETLKSGVSVTSTGGTVSVGEGVQFNTSSLSGTGTPAIVNNGGTVTLDTASTASSLFTSITGDSGTMVMNQQVLLNNGVSSSFGGTLVVNNVKTEAYGDGGQNNKTGYDLVLGDNNVYNTTADISSFSKVVLKNAGLYYAGNGTTINNLTLESGSYSKLKVEHMDSGTSLTFAGETSLAANSELTAMSTWASRVTFEHLVGEGTLMLKGSNRSSNNDSATYTVNSLQGFSGTLNFHKINNNPLIANIYTGTGEDVTLKGISLTEMANNGKGNTVSLAGAEHLTVNGAINVGAGATLNIRNDKGLTTHSLTGAGTTVATAPLSIALNGDATYSGSLTVNELIIQGSGTQTLNGTNTLNEGAEIQNGATLALGGATTIGATVNNSGTLSLGGTIQVDATKLHNFDIAGDPSSAYSGTGAYAGSGFLNAATMYLVKNSGTVTGDFSGTVGSITPTKNAETGDITFTVSDRTTYYVNSNLTYATDQMGEATNLFIAADKTLTVTGSANPATNKTLQGSGTYLVQNKTNIGKVSLGTDWTGTVKLTNGIAMYTGVNLSDLGNENSWVELNYVTSVDDNWVVNQTNTITSNLILTDASATQHAWELNNGGGNALNTYHFTGAIKGSGTIYKTGAYRHDLIFSGDVSGWTGALTFAANPNNAPNVTFQGNATEINAAVQRTYADGNVMTLILGDITNGATAYQFNNTVTVNKITATNRAVVLGSHGEGESATHGNLTLTATSTMDSLTLNDGAQADLGSVKHNINTLTINDGSSVTTSFKSGGDGFIKGNVNVNAGGTLWLNRDDTLGWGNNSTTAINMEGAEGKLATMKVSDKQTFSTTLNLNGYTNVINGDGSSSNKGLEIFENGSRIGTINATGTHNTIATGVFLRSKGTITTAEGAELTISGDVKAGVAGGNAEMVKEGAGTLTLSGDNSFGGNLTVKAGTIVMGSSHALGAANNTGSRTITINSGATIDLHGTDDRMYKYTLAGGSLVNNGSGTNTGHLQTMGLVLTDDSIIGGTGDYHLINSNYGNTAVDLGGHTLTKTGSNTIGFYSTAVSGAAGSKLRIEGGALNFTRNAGWNQTFTSLDADLEVAKSDSSAVNGEFIMAAGHSISSTEMGGSVNAAIQLGGATTLSIDGVNTLTLNGVISNAANATGSVTKTGVGTAILNAANTYTGTTTIDAGALIASNSDALSHSVVSFSDLSEEESPYRMLAFAENLSFNGATGALSGGTQIDGTIKGLDGHLGYVVAKTLTIDVDGGQTHRFWHRYDASNQTNDRVEMKVDRLVKTGAGTQVIGGDYSEARGFTTNGLVISHGVEVQQGELHMMTRGIVTTDFNVLAGATLKTSDERANSATAAGAVQYNGKVTLHGTTADNAAKLFYEDGATNTVNGLYVDGYGTVINNWDKNQFIGGLFNAEGTSRNELTFLRKDHDDVCDVNPAISVLTASGDFAGTIHIKNEGNHDQGPSMLAEKYGLQVLGTGAQNSLANTVVDFTGDNVSVLSFRNSDTASATWTDSKMDGAVAGLQGTNGAVYANTLTINTAAADADYTFGGAMNVSGITKQGAGTQTLNGNLSTFTGVITTDGGKLVLDNADTAENAAITASKLVMNNSSVLEVKNGTTLKVDETSSNVHTSSFSAGSSIIADGVVDFSSDHATRVAIDHLIKTTTGEGTLKLKTYGSGHAESVQLQMGNSDWTLGVKNLEIVNSTLDINNWNSGANMRSFTVGAGHSMTVDKDLRLESTAALVVEGDVTVKETLILGYPSSSVDTHLSSALTINEGGHLKVKTFTINNPNEKPINLNGGTFEFTNSSDLSVSGTATFNLNGGKLKASGSGNVTIDHAVNVGGEVTLEAANENTLAIQGDINVADDKLADAKINVSGSVYLNSDSVGVKRVDVKTNSLLALKQGTAVNLNELVLSEGAAVITHGETAAALLADADEPTPYSGEEVTAHVTVGGTQEMSTLQASGTTTVSTNLTVAGNTQMVYSSDVPQGEAGGINLNGHSLTLSSEGANIFITADMLATINDSRHLTLFSNVGGLTLNGVDFSQAMTKVNDTLYVTTANNYFSAAQRNPLGDQITVAFNTVTRELYLAPEPTTTALSLLALGALAVRRRRH